MDFLSIQHNPQIEHPELKSVQVVAGKWCYMSFTVILSIAYIIFGLIFWGDGAGSMLQVVLVSC